MLLRSLACRHGSAAPEILQEAKSLNDLGEHFGHTLYSSEVDYLIQREWALTADDILWRRTKVGLHANSQQKQALVHYLHSRTETPVQ